MSDAPTLDAATGLQLRVLDGLHKGAAVALQAFAQGLRLGASAEADVQLRDAPQEAQLQNTDNTWTWREEDFSQTLQAGDVWRWGQVVLGLAPASAPWPETWAALVFDRAAVRQEPAADVGTLGAPLAQEVTTDPVADETLLEPPLFSEPGQAAALGPGAPSGSGGGSLWSGPWTAARVSAVSAMAIGGALGALTLAAWWLAPSPQQTPLTQAAPAAPVNLKQVRQVLTQQGMEMLVQATVRPDGRLLLRGVVPDEAQLDALMGAIRKVTQRVNLMVITQSEFVARVKALGRNLPEGIRTVIPEVGHLVLMAERQDVNWTLAEQLVEGEVPESVFVEYLVRDPADPRAPAPAPMEAQPSDSAAFARLPRITAVLGGERPHVLLAQGEKWLPGGKVGGLILQAIEDQALVFEDAQGRQWRKPR